MADYNTYYQAENLFGEAYPELIAFFEQYEPKGRLLDIGCGQGRDCIPLAILGYEVTGIDSSKVGIDQMIEKSEHEKLNIKGLVGDIYTFDNYQNFDIVILDSMFHFEKRDLQKETDLIVKIAHQIPSSGVICFCIQNTGHKVNVLKVTIKNLESEFTILNDSSLIFNYEDTNSGHKSESNYCMYIVKKK